MQQDSKLEGWEVVSHEKEKRKRTLFPHFWSILWKPEKSSNTVNPVTVSAILLSKVSEANIFKQQLYFMKGKEGEWEEHQNPPKHEGMTHQSEKA